VDASDIVLPPVSIDVLHEATRLMLAGFCTDLLRLVVSCWDSAIEKVVVLADVSQCFQVECSKWKKIRQSSYRSNSGQPHRFRV
jgi:hypothetical protein